MSRTYDRLRSWSQPLPRMPVVQYEAEPERVPNPMITPAVSQAEAREDQWERLQAHYLEHQGGPLLVLLRGGHSELILTQQCPDCQRYGLAFDAHQRGEGTGDVLAGIWT